MKVHWLLPSFVSVVLLSHPAKADTSVSWRFNANQNQLDLTTDEGVQPKVQLIADPTRLVIDLPGVNLGHPQTKEKVGPVIQEIRVGQFDSDTTRMVIELAPGYKLDPTKVRVRGESATHWFVQLPTPERIVGNSPVQTGSIGAIAPQTSQSSHRIAVAPAPLGKFAGVIPLNAEMPGLEPQVKALMARYSFLKTGMFFLDLDTGNYLDIGGDRVFPAASTIKLPILIAFFQDLDAGKVSLDETLVMQRRLITGGSGTMQYNSAGTKFSARETVTKMITISDNTATNMIIDRLGGITKLNQRFRSWGLKDTIIRNWLADLRGTNTTSSKDMVRLLALLINNQLVSLSSREQVLDILRHTTIKTLLPAGLGPGADIADKTGDIGFLIGDAGVITMPNGKRYLAGIFVRRPYKDSRGRDFIRQVSSLVYNYLNQYTAGTPVVSPMHQSGL
ncbi:MAG TPA: serine hydrolase [Cyanobacteria bacterium UBA8553]|nr:serine hydrolase [Cyanobacteria bacterium UBA8553]HAJ61937.1 serine hydrolase [Cyanobacteria bacterium UBA8543]